MTTSIATTITITSCVCAAIITCLLMFGTALAGNTNKKLNRCFFIALLFNTIGACFEGLSALMIGKQGDTVAAIYKAADFFSYTCGSLVTIAFALYVYEYLSLKRKVAKAPFVFMILFSCANIALITVGQITERFMLLDASNSYNPQGLTVWAQIFPSLMLLTLIAVILWNAKLFTAKEWGSFLVYAIMPIVCYGIENFFMEYPLWITYFGVAVVLLLVYVNIQVELKNMLIKKEAELMESRVAVMLSQIQPHFLHNTLAAIYELCDENSAAQEAIGFFSDYLRGNMASLNQKGLVPIETELKHVRHYLWLEQLRFADRLRVEYDTGDILSDDFYIPTLTIQPIVENAVCHGVTEKPDGGTVLIRTEETETCCRISISDDGVGFDTNAPFSDERGHIGLANVRSRLAVLCGGTLEISSNIGMGTTVTIEIPRRTS